MNDPGPRLSRDDARVWDTWRLTFAMHARTEEYRRAVDRAKASIFDALGNDGPWALMWSGGKDSTAMAHLASAETMGAVPLVSEKDDLDYPGEREYVTKLALEWGASLKIITPRISPAAWLSEHGFDLDGADDVHGRSAGLSKACFYREVETANEGCAGIFLGLRSEESKGRRLNRASHGLLYRKRNGQLISQPIADWTGMDVFAYLQANGIEVLPVYRCVALMHRHEPWRIRKSWWIPGAHGARGQVTWLRHYWPELYLQLCEWVPAAKGLG